jgi:hypothetical protein
MEVVLAAADVAAPLELIGAAGIIYFALPDAGHPGFFIVLGAFCCRSRPGFWRRCRAASA